jgi:hypothetical protein
MRDPIDPPLPVPLPSEAELAEARDAFNKAVGWQPPARALPERTGPRAHWKKVDWGRAARLIAGGATVEAAAAALGCGPDRLLRNLRRSAKFRYRIDHEVERMKLSARLRFAALGEEATRQMQRQAHELDPRLLQWLGEKLNLNQQLRATLGDQWAEAARTPPRRKAAPMPAQTGRNGT